MQTTKEAKNRVRKSRTQAKAQRQGRHSQSRVESQREDENLAKKKQRQLRRESNAHEREVRHQIQIARDRLSRLLRSRARQIEDQELAVLVAIEEEDDWFVRLEELAHQALALGNQLEKSLKVVSRQLSGRVRRPSSRRELLEKGEFLSMLRNLESTVGSLIEEAN